MTTPHVRDPKPLADSLIPYTEDDPTPLSLLANGLRAALYECAEEQDSAVHGLGRSEDLTFRALCYGRLETANHVVRRVEEALVRLPEAKNETVRMVAVEAWLKGRRDWFGRNESGWIALNDALDDLREHSQTGTPLDEDVKR